MSIPRTSLQSKSSRLALVTAGAAAAVTVMASGGAAAAAGGPAASYRIAAGPAVSRIQPVSGQHPSPPAASPPAASQHRAAAHRTAAGRLRLSLGGRLAAAARGTASHRPGQRTEIGRAHV